jgi:hypothetical protein
MPRGGGGGGEEDVLKKAHIFTGPLLGMVEKTVLGRRVPDRRIPGKRYVQCVFKIFNTLKIKFN